MNFRTAPLCLVLLPTLALAQTADSTAVYPYSIGFEDPGDVSALLEYRLPDWSWYTWDATLGLNAAGSNDENLSGSNLRSTLGTNYTRYRETDPRQWNLSAGLSGFASRVNVDRDPPGSDSLEQTLQGRATLGAGITEYLVDNFGVSAAGSASAYYAESKAELDTLPETLRLGRLFESRVYGGVTFGRTRNVSPVLRAHRVSERLVELGRPALSPARIRGLADRIARQSGYLQVFDRSEKYFWASLLEEITGGEPLPGRDLLYLLEVFDESYGVRLQGLRADLGLEYRGSKASGDLSPGATRDLLVSTASVTWYENLSLEHQLDAFLLASYSIWNDEQPASGLIRSYDNRRELSGGIGDLLLLTDRWRWSNALSGRIISRQSLLNGEWMDDAQADYRSSIIVFVEDRLSLTGSMVVSYASQELPSRVDERWDWGLNASLSYQLGQGIY